MTATIINLDEVRQCNDMEYRIARVRELRELAQWTHDVELMAAVTDEAVILNIRCQELIAGDAARA